MAELGRTGDVLLGVALPHRFNVGVAFVIGLLLDSLQGTLLGQNALALVITVYIVCKLRDRLRVNPLLQQTLMIGVLLFLYSGLLFWPQGILGALPRSSLYWLSPVMSLLFWPVVQWSHQFF